jgi:hypothetical protein
MAGLPLFVSFSITGITRFRSARSFAESLGIG